MKYKILFKFLRSLIYLKRFLWWTGDKIGNSLNKLFSYFWRFIGFFYYKVGYFWDKSAVKSNTRWFMRRDNLQILLFIILLFVAIPQTKLYAKKGDYMSGQNSLAYSLSNRGEEFSLEAIVVDDQYVVNYDIDLPTWKEGTLTGEAGVDLAQDTALMHERDLAAVMAGGSALSKPTILPGADIGAVEVVVSDRKEAIDYTIQEGDSLGLIAQKFGISLATLLWDNNLTSRSIIRSGKVLSILPVSGIRHTVKSGDTVLKIANLYDGKASEIIEFNNLKSDGSLRIGDKIVVPNGAKKTYSTSRSRATTQSSRSVIAPPPSQQSPATSGFVWPSSAKIITQYYHWQHHGLDVAGPWQSTIYAAKAGKVETSQCGWNSGYGCYVVINHGGGVKTLYGHHSKLLVSAGDHVERGQTIGLMGNTGQVYGPTGIHLHFEIQINGVRVNPLGYIR